MKIHYVRPTEQGRKRQAWFKAHLKPGMAKVELFTLIERALHLFPVCPEERRLKAESLKNIPEFVL